MKKLFLFILVSIMIPVIALAENQVSISGKVKDSKTGEPLPSATVCLFKKSSPNDKKYRSTDLDGNYSFDKISLGNYIIQVTYVGYKSEEEDIKVNREKRYSINILMDEDSQIIGEVFVQGRATRAEQKGDSLLYNAEAFKVMKGSSAEDLLSKMPGIVVQGGTIEAQGESVRKILVDGKEFFEGDVNLALKNLPSDIIASIEVFDKKSEQAEFTGFDDGSEIKTINIVTKGGYREGVFGEIYGGYGTEDRYKAGGNVNVFKDDLRLSFLGMSNNVNNQNFSQEDLAGVMSSSSGGGKRGGKGGGGKGGKGGGGKGGGSSASNFMVGSLGGITKSNGAGFNYVDQWNDKMKFTGSYFFNQSTNNTIKDTEREFFESALPGMTYSEYTESQMKNYNHRVNMKYDYQINESNALQIRPSLSFQNNDSYNFMQGANKSEGELTNDVQNNTNNDSRAYNIGTEINYRYKFPTEGRTLSLMLSGNVSNTNGDSYTDYINKTFGKKEEIEEYGQYKKTLNKQYSYKGSLNYTERLFENMQLQATYKVSYSNSDSDRKVYKSSSNVTDLYDQLDESLSNVYSSDYITQAGGLGLRYRKNKLSVMLGGDFQWSKLQGNQTYPLSDNLKHNYFSVLPSMVMRYSLNSGNSFQLRYRSSSSAPSISDLQNVVDNSNPLYLSTGNPDLDQQISHTLNLRYLLTTKSGHTFIAMLGGTMKQNFIADSTYIAKENENITPTIELVKGAQFTKPVNMNGYYSVQSMLTYGFPIDFIRSNLNFSVSANYSKAPTIFDGKESKTSELNLIPKVIIGSNVSENLDFTLSYSAGINNVYNSLDSYTSDNYINHTAQAKFGWTFWKGFTLSSNCSYIGYTGLESGNNQYVLLNASNGKRFLKNNVAEIKLEAFDLLKQNQAFSRNVGSNYYEYVTSNVLQPYFMLSFSYMIR